MVTHDVCLFPFCISTNSRMGHGLWDISFLFLGQERTSSFGFGFLNRISAFSKYLTLFYCSIFQWGGINYFFGLFPILRCLATVQTHVWSPYHWKWMDKGWPLFGILFKLLDWYKYYPWWSQTLAPSNSGWSCESIIKVGIESPHSQLYQLLKSFSLNSVTNNIQKNIF